MSVFPPQPILIMSRIRFQLLTGVLIACTSGSLMAQSTAVDENLLKATEAYADYDFGAASRHLADARKALPKGERSEGIDRLERQMRDAKAFLSRIEKLQILDSISVPEAEFFKAYRLPSASGSIANADALPDGIDNRDELRQQVELVFTNEDADFKMWAQPASMTQDPDSLDIPGSIYRMVESSRLTDGSWQSPVPLPISLAQGGNMDFPFMKADGVTLYFASDGERSIGGYDIFVVTRDPLTGEYLQPQNIGMPYNSPDNDYMLAIDEINGVGWWATDRNAAPDMVTLYLFKLNDLRSNYDADEDDDFLISKARIEDFRSTQDPDQDYTPLIEEIGNIQPQTVKSQDFIFHLPGKRVYTSYGDFRNSSARSLMHEYIRTLKDIQNKEAALAELRKRFDRRPDDSLRPEILRSEADLEATRKQLKRLRNDIYKAEL